MIALAILLTGIGSYAMRAFFIFALARYAFPPLLLRALEYVAPTVMALEMQAGVLTELVKPLLPLAMTVAMPALRRLLITVVRGSVPSQAEKFCPPPRLILIEARLRLARLR